MKAIESRNIATLLVPLAVFGPSIIRGLLTWSVTSLPDFTWLVYIPWTTSLSALSLLAVALFASIISNRRLAIGVMGATLLAMGLLVAMPSSAGEICNAEFASFGTAALCAPLTLAPFAILQVLTVVWGILLQFKFLPKPSFANKVTAKPAEIALSLIVGIAIALLVSILNTATAFLPMVFGFRWLYEFPPLVSLGFVALVLVNATLHLWLNLRLTILIGSATVMACVVLALVPTSAPTYCVLELERSGFSLATCAFSMVGPAISAATFALLWAVIRLALRGRQTGISES